jgi:hypothetical protein
MRSAFSNSRWAVLGAIALTLGCASKAKIGLWEDDPSDAGVADGATPVTFTGDASEGDPLSITLSPSSVDIDVDNGNVAGKSVTFTATATYGGGATSVLGNCAWSVDNLSIGGMSGAAFQPAGTAGGVGTVKCEVGNAVGKATVHVRLHDVADTAQLDGVTRAALLAATNPDPSLSRLLYPYDGTVFPRGLAPPELMWDAVQASDVYAIRIEEPDMDLTLFTRGVAPARATIPKDSWTRLLETSTGGTATVKVSRMAGGPGGQAYLSTTQTWTLSTANLTGSVWYWAMNRGQLVKLKTGSNTPQPAINQSGCVGCHAVSHDGSTVAVGLTASATVAAYDAKTGNRNFAGSTQSGYRAVSADGRVIAWVPALGSNGYVGEPVELADAKTGASLEPSGFAAAGLTTTPAFSPDNLKIAFGVRNPTPPGTSPEHNSFSGSDLAIADFNPLTNKVGPKQTLRASGGATLLFPSFTPDSKYLAYQEGNQARARHQIRNDKNMPWSNQPSRSELRFIAADGSGDVELTAAGKGGLAAVDLNHNFQPHFSPVVQGGYFWVVFMSLRQYGNRLTRTADWDYGHCNSTNFSDCRMHQLWIAAVDANPTPGQDPSHPAFWMPGQDVNDQNIDGYWVLDPCKQVGESCSAGFDCCAGACRGTPKKCVVPPPNTCAHIEEKCTTTADCCGTNLGVECIAGFCSKRSPK